MDYGEEDEFAEEDGNAELGNEWFLRIGVRGVVIRTRISTCFAMTHFIEFVVLFWLIIVNYDVLSEYFKPNSLLIAPDFNLIWPKG